MIQSVFLFFFKLEFGKTDLERLKSSNQRRFEEDVFVLSKKGCALPGKEDLPPPLNGL